MAKMSDLNVCVNVCLFVSDETVKGCLNLITMWLNEDPNRAIRGGARHDDGKIEPLRIDKSNWKDGNDNE